MRGPGRANISLTFLTLTRVTLFRDLSPQGRGGKETLSSFSLCHPRTRPEDPGQIKLLLHRLFLKKAKRLAIRFASRRNTPRLGLFTKLDNFLCQILHICPSFLPSQKKLLANKGFAPLSHPLLSKPASLLSQLDK